MESSAGFTAVMTAAKAAAGASMLGTEHILLGILNTECSAKGWLGVWGLDVEALTKAVTASSSSSSSSSSTGGAGAGSGSADSASVSPNVDTVLATTDILAAAVKSTSRSSEALLLSVLLSAVDGTSAGLTLVRLLKEKDPSLDVNKIVSDVVGPDAAAAVFAQRFDHVIDMREKRMDWHTFCVCPPGVSTATAPPTTAADVSVTLPPLVTDDFARMEGPDGSGANWLVPGHVLMGPQPGYGEGTTEQGAIRALLGAGVDMFVCLKEEWSLREFQTRRYPKVVRAWAAETSSGPRHRVDFHHFPIPDFTYGDAAGLTALGQALAREVKGGRRLYVHCQGGHGRTGMVVIDLLVSLYDISADDARRLVVKYHSQRKHHSPYCSHVPETGDQVMRVRQLETRMRREAGKK